MRFRSPDVWCCVFLILLPTLLLWKVIYGHDIFLPADLLHDIAPWRAANPAHRVPWVPLLWDSMAEFYPWRLFAAQTLHQGWIPLWNPHQFCGTPFVANSQSAVFYPLNLLFLIMPVARAFGINAWLQLALAGMFLFGFLRCSSLRVSCPAALFGAVAWQMSAWQVSWLALPTFLSVSCWLPLALWLVYRSVDRPESIGRWAGVGVCCGVMILGGHLQIAFYCLGLVVIYGLFLLSSLRRLPWGVWIAVGIAVGLAAPQVLPTVELARVSARSATPTTWHSYHSYVALAVPVVNLVTLWLPGFFGNPTFGTYWGEVANGGPGAYMENACYIGILALALACLGVAATWKARRETRFFAVAALVALLMALGTPLDAVPFFGLPGFSQSASPGRILVLWTLCASVLAALGAETVISQIPLSKKITVLSGAIFVGVSAVVIGGVVWWISEFGPPGVLAFNLPRVGDLWREPLGILGGGAVLVWFGLRGSLGRPAMGYLLAGLAALDLLAAGLGFNHAVPVSAVYPSTPGISYLAQHAGTGRVLILNHDWSLSQTGPQDALMPPNSATVYGLNDVAGYDSLLTRQSFQFIARIDGGKDPAPPENGNLVFAQGFANPEADEAAAEYVVSPVALDAPTMQLVDRAPQMFIYRNAASQPLAHTASGVGAAQIAGLSPTRLQIEVHGAGADYLDVAEQWYPGWQATVNGKRVPLKRWDRFFDQIAIPSRSTFLVTLQYAPDAFRVGLYGFALALGASLGILSYCLCRRRDS